MLKLKKFMLPFWPGMLMVIILTMTKTMTDLKLPALMAEIVNKGIVNNDMTFIMNTGAFMLVIALFGTICAIISGYGSAKIASKIGVGIREALFTHVEGFSLPEFNELNTSTLITRTTNDITQIQNVVLISLRMLVMAPLMCIGGAYMAAKTGSNLLVILLIALPIIGFAIFMVSKKAIPLFKINQKRLDKLNGVTREILIGVRTIRAYNKTEYEKSRFQAANKNLTDVALKIERIAALLMPIMMLVLNMTTVAVVWLGAKQIDAGAMEIGDIMAFIQYATQILMSLLMLAMMFVMIPRAAASAERINEVFEMEYHINDKEKTVILPKLDKAELAFNNVSFGYGDAKEKVLHNIDFTIYEGQTLAIIGGTGSGKSTLINLIPRLYDVTDGSIKINGIDIRDMKQAELRNKIAYVPQKAVLFTGSIKENILLGALGASDERVQHAADVAQASEFINLKERGINDRISQGGTNVSGGQKQRLAIARALMRDALIYIFDDSFSALDFKTDRLLREALAKENENAITIIVAQRVTSIISADKILVLDDGAIVGIGTHKELINTCDIYKEIVLSQLSKEEAYA